MKTYYKKLLSVVTIVAVLINVVGCSTSTQPSDENKGNANNEIVETPKDDDFEQKPQDEDNDKEDEKDKTEDKGKVDEAVSNDKDKENKPTQPSKDEEKPSKPANIPNDNGNNGTKPTQPEPTPDPKPEEPTNPQPNPKPEEPSKPEQPHEHNFMKTVIEPDCDNEGYTKYECKCGYSYQDNKTAALGDDWANG